MTLTWRDRIENDCASANEPTISPQWTRNVPFCREECPYHDGKRCSKLGHRPADHCEPAIAAMAKRAAAHVAAGRQREERVAELESALSGEVVERRRAEGQRDALAKRGVELDRKLRAETVKAGEFSGQLHVLQYETKRLLELQPASPKKDSLLGKAIARVVELLPREEKKCNGGGYGCGNPTVGDANQCPSCIEDIRSDPDAYK